MWLFVVSDALTFSTLLAAYTYMRIANSSWPRPFPLSPSIVAASMMTLVLLSSSLTMVLAVEAMRRDDRMATVRWLGATMASGLVFIALHLNEWKHLLLHEKDDISSNPSVVPL